MQHQLDSPIVNTKRINSLDGLRGCAIIFIIAHHYFGKNFTFLWIGVDLFFVLSGFLITRILLESINASAYFRNFYMRRILRIFPLYFTVLIILFLFIPHFLNNFVYSDMFSYLSDNQLWFWTYTENWLFLKTGWPKGSNIILAHFWSLAIEEQFYIVWPLFIFFIRKTNTLIFFIALTIITSILYRSFGGLGNPGYYVSTLCRMDGLLIGGLIALLYKNYPQFLMKFVFVIFITSGTIIVSSLFIVESLEYSNLFYRTIGYTLLSVFFGSVLTLLLKNDRNYFTRVFESKILTFFGKYSYGMYVFHFPVFWLLRIPSHEYMLDTGIPIMVSKIVVSLFCLIITILLSLLSYKFIEKPFLKLKKVF